MDRGAWRATVHGVTKSQTQLRYNFLFLLFTGSTYWTLFLLDCFDFAYGCICVCVYSVILFIVIKLCFYMGFCSSLEFSFFIFLFLFSSFFSLFIILIFKTCYSFSTFIPLFAFPTVLFPLQLIFNVYKSFYLSLFNFVYLFFLFFLSS